MTNAIGMRDRFGRWHDWADIRKMPRTEQIRLFRMIPGAPYRETRSDRAGRAKPGARGDAMP
jgi:hypothetical protein